MILLGNESLITEYHQLDLLDMPPWDGSSLKRVSIVVSKYQLAYIYFKNNFIKFKN